MRTFYAADEAEPARIEDSNIGGVFIGSHKVYSIPVPAFASHFRGALAFWGYNPRAARGLDAKERT